MAIGVQYPRNYEQLLGLATRTYLIKLIRLYLAIIRTEDLAEIIWTNFEIGDECFRT